MVLINNCYMNSLFTFKCTASHLRLLIFRMISISQGSINFISSIQYDISIIALDNVSISALATALGLHGERTERKYVQLLGSHLFVDHHTRLLKN